MAKIIVTYGIPDEGLKVLADHEVIMPAPLTAFSQEELLALIPDADAVLAGSRLTGEVIRAGKQLKIIANYGAGYDAVDVKTAKDCGVPVTNIPEKVTESTAELALGLMLAVARRIGEMTLRMRKEQPESLFGMGRYMGANLRGMTLGIVGAGRIGGRTAELAKAFGMRVVGYSRRGADPRVMEPMGLDDLLRVSDVVSLHCPLTDETRGLIDADAIAKMKPGAILINTSRGAVVDSEALAEALRTGHLSGAGLDVFPEEPHVPQCFVDLDNVVLTPHVGTNTSQARCEMAEACCMQILDALAGKRPVNIVNGL